MPEYLSPGVYMEEFEIGAKPIEGVSTSTAGFLGMTQRGPLDKPTLVTSMGEYNQIFGGYIDKKEGLNIHYLPYAVEAFFANGGKRVYVTRVAKRKDASNPSGAYAKTAEGFIPDVSGGITSLKGTANAKSITIKLNTPLPSLNQDDILLIKDKEQSEYVKYISKAKNLILRSGLYNKHDKDTSPVTSIKKVDKDTAQSYTAAGTINKDSMSITLSASINTGDLADYTFLYIDDGVNSEIVHVKVDPVDNKKINLDFHITKNHADGIKLYKFKDNTPSDSIALLTNVSAGSKILPVDPTGPIYAAGDIIQIGTGTSVDYVIVEKVEENMILLDEETRYTHADNIAIVKLSPAIKIEALNQGKWGEKLKIITKSSSINDKISVSTPSTGDILEINSLVGVEEGTILKIGTPPAYQVVKKIFKTTDKNKVQINGNIAVTENAKISTEEFDIEVFYDNNLVEVFKNLSLNADHSRFVDKIITEKTSNFITATYNTSALDPIVMPTEDKAPGWLLKNGNDGLPADELEMNTIYTGVDKPEPDDRRGLYTLKNIDDISIVAIPGITTQYMQAKLINHCELMKYRFAVLDSEPTANLDKIQEQRNYYDSDYAALYYPWISVFDPASKGNINIPPSGSMCGIYARSDVERGVHKAPANEVVSLALDLEDLGSSHRIITTGQQDILNPKGVNCIRVFSGRGIRVWGARTLTSDPLWKYINVRRTFIYLEKSIEQGTQWIVFEPNDQGLWARVKQTITQFLTDAWRSGMLMGATPEEAFFVKCDRTTMSQGDIDNGRLICVIGVAPVKPAEFVIFRIAQWTGGAKN